MNFMKILSDMHKQTFNSNNRDMPPFEYTIKCENIKKINLENLTKRAYCEYKNFNMPRGSIDMDPVYWTGFFIKHCKDEKVIITNGCCTVSDCPFKLYFEILERIINSL